MQLSLSDLPWFIRYSIIEYVLIDYDVRLILPPADQTGHLRGITPHPPYHTLCVLNKRLSEDSRLILCRVATIMINKADDLVRVLNILTPAEVQAVQRVGVEINWKYENDGLSLLEKNYDSLSVSYHALRRTFPHLKYLHVIPDPGSSNKFYCQSSFETLMEFQMEDMVVDNKFFSPWGIMAWLANLVFSSVLAMGDKVDEWVQTLIDLSNRDGDIELFIHVDFQCAADPRIPSENLTGYMSTKDYGLIVEYDGHDYLCPQTFSILEEPPEASVIIRLPRYDWLGDGS